MMMFSVDGVRNKSTEEIRDPAGIRKHHHSIVEMFFILMVYVGMQVKTYRSMSSNACN